MSEILPVKYPRSLETNVKYRIELVQRCLKDAALAADVKALCKEDIIFWFDVFCWTKNPRRSPSILPFITYEDYQIMEILKIQHAIRHQYDYLIEKSRDMGVSYLVLYVFQHEWMFNPEGPDFRCGSRKEEYVDRPNDIDTLFEKLRFNLEKMPPFLVPKGFNWKAHSTYMKMINPETGAAIVGESANEDFGSGGRRRACLMDEFSKWENRIATAAWTATSDVTKCRIPVSTPKGAGNKFATLASGTQEKIKKTTIHWTLHPDKAKGAYYINKNGEKVMIKGGPKGAFKKWIELGRPVGVVRSPWYDSEADRSTLSDLAQEKDIHYAASGFPFFNLESLAKQLAWEYLVRKRVSDPIPYGRYIRVNLLKIDNRIEYRELPHGQVKVFEFPNKVNEYALGGDVSEGLAKGDESYLVVRNKWTRNVVATANGLYGTDELAVLAQILSEWYGMCITGVESNNHGHSVNQDLKNMACNLYYTKKRHPETGKISIVRAGWTTTSTTRPFMLDQLEEEVRRCAAEFRDPDILAQMKTFVRDEKTGKPQADGDLLDDGVIATAICGIMIQEHPYKPTHDKDRARKRQQHDQVKHRKNAGFTRGY